MIITAPQTKNSFIILSKVISQFFRSYANNFHQYTLSSDRYLMNVLTARMLSLRLAKTAQLLQAFRFSAASPNAAEVLKSFTEFNAAEKYLQQKNYRLADEYYSRLMNILQ